MSNPAWDDHSKAREALHTIVSDPVYGVAALSSSQTMANLLKDLLPDAPREASILAAAADADVASSLQDHISKGMDVGTASALVSGSFAARMPFKPEACSWAVSEIAVALGLDPDGKSAPRATSQPGGAQQTRTAMPPIAPGTGDPQAGIPQAGYPQAGHPRGGYPQAGYPQGGHAQGGYPQAGIPQAGHAQGGYPQAGHAQGGEPQPGDPQAGYPQAGYPQGGYPSAGQAPPPGAYPSAPQHVGNSPGVYQPVAGPGYWQQQSGRPPSAKTNGLAIASLVLGIVWFFWLGSAVGLILGLVGLRQIKDRNEGGRGIAIAGIVLSAVGLAGLILIIILGAIGASTSNVNGT